MKSKKKQLKNNIRYFSVLEYLFTLILLGVLGALPALMYGGEMFAKHTRPYIVWYILYWAIVTALFFGFTFYQKYNAYDKPMRALSEATNRVAAGDFSIYLKPVHSLTSLNYIDVMFKDFNKMVEELGSLETMKSDFISNVSHEIKTPLAVIQNYASALQEENISPEYRKECAETIATASQNLTSLVTNILKLNKLENQEILPPAQPYDVCRQLYDCVLSFEQLWEAKNIKLVADIEDRAYILAEPSMVEIIWRNLLSNSIKFTEANGTIALTQTSDETNIVVTITDSGRGMDEATLKRIFDKFYQGDTSHAEEGNGLGLALTNRVIELLGGSITVDSELGAGTTFVVKLPTA